MNSRPSRRRRERLTADGAVILSHNQLAFLHGLLDRPGCRAATMADMVRAAIPYVRLFRDSLSWSCLEKAALNVPPEWVERGRDGRRRTWTLTPRGHAILDRAVPAHLHGLGPYQGLAPLRQGARTRLRAECREARIHAAGRGVATQPLPAAGEALVFAWRMRNAPVGYLSGLLFENNLRRVRLYIANHLANHGTLPTGTRHLDATTESMRVDFDALRGVIPVRLTDVEVENAGDTIVFRSLSLDALKAFIILERAGATMEGETLACHPTVALDVLRALATRE